MNDGTQTPPDPTAVQVTGTVAPPQGQTDDGARMADMVLENELRRARDEAAEFRSKLRDTEKERDGALAQVATLQTELESVKASTAELTAKLTEAETAKATAAEQLQQIAEKRHAAVLESIPEDKREAVKDWSVEQLEVLASQFVAAAPPVKPAGSVETGAPGTTGTEYDPSKMTVDQLADLDPSTLGSVIDKQLQQGPKPFGLG